MSTVWRQVGSASRLDLEAVVAVHLQAFPDFLLSQLGPGFLRQYYRAVADYSRGILLCVGTDDDLDGFAAGFVDPAAFYRHLRERRLHFATSAVIGLLRHPSRVKALASNVSRAANIAASQSIPDIAELSSIAVRPGARKRGVGSKLVRKFIAESERNGATQVTLTTDAANNEAANTFYRRLGFECRRTFESRPGRIMNEYTIKLSER